MTLKINKLLSDDIRYLNDERYYMHNDGLQKINSGCIYKFFMHFGKNKELIFLDVNKVRSKESEFYTDTVDYCKEQYKHSATTLPYFNGFHKRGYNYDAMMTNSSPSIVIILEVSLLRH